MHLLHVIPSLSGGGGASTLVEWCERFAGAGVAQTVLTLDAASPDLCGRLASAGVTVAFTARADVETLIAAQDAVLLHFWQTARLAAFLRREWPPVRIAVVAHVLGSTPGQCLTPGVLDLADVLFAASPATLTISAVAARDIPKLHVASTGDFTRITPRAADPPGPVNVGYAGLVDFVKLHRDYVAMTAAVGRPIVADVCGGGSAYPALREEAARLGAAERFRWRGHVANIGEALAGMHVFGYPLAEDTYATSERVLQEAMYAGLPAVVFDRPGYRDYVDDGADALVVRDQAGYVAAVTALVDDPGLRCRIGAGAHARIVRDFDPVRYGERLLRGLADLVRSAPKRPRPALAPAHPRYAAAGLFVDALGGFAPAFRTSLDALAGAARDDADAAIAAIPEALRNPGAGGVFDYRTAFPRDAMLAYWCGLSEARRGAHANALAHFLVARREGLDPERLDAPIRAAHARLARRETQDAPVP